MKRMINVSVAGLLLVSSSLVLADGPRGHQGRHGDMTADVVKTRPDGRKVNIHAEQKKTEDGFERHATMTSEDGKVRVRDVKAVVDKENKTITKTITTTGPDGKTETKEVVKKMGEHSKAP